MSADKTSERPYQSDARRFALVEQAALEGIYEWFINRNEIYVSPRLHKIFGFEPGEIGSKDWRWNERIHPDDLETYEIQLKAYIDSPAQSRWQHEYRFVGKDGDYRWILDRASCERDNTGKAVRMVGAITDVTQSRARAAELEHKSALLELILENVDQGISVISSDLRFIMFNSKFLELHRLPPDRFKVGDHIEGALRYGAQRGEYGPGDIEALVAERLQKISTFRPDAYERIRSDGTTLEIKHAPLPGGGYVSTYTDVTERKRTELALRTSEDRYNLAQQSVNEGIYDWDIDNNQIYYSPRVIDVLGLNPETMKTREDWFERIHPKDAQHFRDNVVAHLKGETERLEIEYRYKDLKGNWRWALQHGIALRDEKGHAYRMIGSTGDISALKESEAEVREQAKILSLILDAMDQGISVVNKDLEVIAFNKRFLELLQFPSDQFKPGFKMEQAFRYNAARGEYGEGDIEKLVRERLKLARKFEAHRFERTRPDGTVIEVWGNPAGDGFISTFTDITQRRGAEESLRQSEERYALATEGANEGIWDWDVKADTIYVSDRVKQLLGLELEGNTVTANQWQSKIHPEDREKMRAAVTAHLRGDTKLYRCELRTVDGQRWLVHSGSVLRNEEGWVYRMAGSIGDITDMVKARQKAEQAHQLARDRNRALESLSSKLAKYLSPQVYSSIFSGQTDVKISAERKKLSVFFSDIVDFTETTDKLEAEELTSILNGYLTEMSRIALDYGATIDKYMGDAILIFFGDPQSRGIQEDARACVEMALTMQRRMQELQVEWQDMGIASPLNMRIGICTGYCTVGNFGSDDRMDYTIIGNPVNVSARIQGLAAPGEIMLAFETYSLVKDRLTVEEQEPVTVKGLLRPVRIFRVTGVAHADQSRIIRKSKDGLEIHLDLNRIKSQDKQEAIKTLQSVLRSLREND